MKRKPLMLGFALLIAMMNVGCSKDSAGSKDSGKTEIVSNDPVTLLVYLQAAVSEEDFKLLFTDPVKKKYPNITLEAIRPKTGTKLADLITAGTIPDLIAAPNADIWAFNTLDLLYDITPLAQARKVDLNRFEPATLEAVKSDKGELWALPYAMEFNTMYYNKDIFDKFGIAYPKDGMTWDETIELAKKVTRDVDGVLYRGLDVVNSNIMGFPFALSYVNGVTNKANINNDQWRKIFDLTKQIQTIPGNEPPSPEPSTSVVANYFVKDRNVAMVVSPNLMKYFGESATGLNWDIAQYPSHKDKPNVSGKVDAHVLTITKPSKHKEDAMKVLEVLTSDEVQLLNVKNTSRISPLKNPEMQKQYGADMPFLKGKNTQAIFKSKVVAPPVYSPYESDGSKIGKQKYKDYMTGLIDANTALRQAEDEINKVLATK
ncbi:extracellular solute-binding protein [Paenibacillus sp. RC67]|uniref:ABC transporter substrate-binding protein n=1 Tax=Paenibacillus sp. RC67 TaxID=3039392 RepID=UPI0024AD6F72|nr:extracellular solute-binding protein [Paenibacillus sp. RC67]